MKKVKNISIFLVLVLISILFTRLGTNYKVQSRNNYQIPSLSQTTLSLNRYVPLKVTETNETNTYVPSHFKTVAETNDLILYVERETLAIIVEVKETGYFWSSYPLEVDHTEYTDVTIRNIKSGVHLITNNQFTEYQRTVLDPKVTIDLETIINGFKATVDFTDIMIRFDLIVQLEDDQLVVVIPNESIEEYNPKLWNPGNANVSIQSIVVYPFFGSTSQQQNGYVVIPDGSGAIVSLTEIPRYKVSYSAPVYGEDLGYKDYIEPSEDYIQTIKSLERITVPIYGVIHESGENGLLVVSEAGASYATYHYQAKGLTTDYYQSYFRYHYRTSYNQYQSRTDTTKRIKALQRNINEFDIKQRYFFLTNDDADYVGVAKTYRDYLEQNNGFYGTVEKGTSYSTHINLIGNEVEMGLFWPRNVVATTYNEANDIIHTLKSDGFDSLDVTYKTFIIDKAAYRFKIMRRLGGKTAFNRLIDEVDKDDKVKFSYFVDYIHTYTQNKSTAKKVNKMAMRKLNLSAMYESVFLNQPQAVKKTLTKDIDRMKNSGITTVSVGGLSDGLFTHYHQNGLVTRLKNMEIIEKQLDQFIDNGINLNLYNPDSYLYAYTTTYYDAPITSSEQMFIDATIPLIPLIVSGKMALYSPELNDLSNETSILLRLVEYGLNPTYTLTGSDAYALKFSNSSHIFISNYSSLKERMTRYDQFIAEGLNAISNVEMVDHRFIDVGVSESVFANGTSIYVNYNNQPYTYEEHIIPARGYLVR